MIYMANAVQVTDKTNDKSDKPKNNNREVYHKDDFNIDNRPLEPYRPRKQDGWRPVGQGSYRKDIGPAE
jgi:hypothetical protein